MKQILAITMLASLFLEAYEIQRTYINGSYKVYVVQCEKGTTIHVDKKLSTNRYYINSNSYSTINSAIDENCEGNNNVITAEKDTVMCKKESDMKDALSSSMGFLLYKMGPEKSCGPLSSGTKVKLIQTYKGKEKGLCSDYFKIKAGDGFWFMNKSKC